MGFQKATKQKIEGRISMFGPPGSGKTWTSLLFAEVLRADGRIALIDTERGKAAVYADRFDFDHETLNHYAPADYERAIKEAAGAHYPVLVIDSLSHAWVGEGGILDQADQLGGKFEVWKTLTPQQRKLVDTILDYPGHVIATMRSKMEYVVEKATNSKGKEVSAPKKVGLAPVQKDDTEYEFDLVLAFDTRNNARVMKSRCPAFEMEADIIKPGMKEARAFLDWLQSGADRPPSEAELRKAIGAELDRLGEKTADARTARVTAIYGRTPKTLGELQAILDNLKTQPAPKG